jgi:hypothetical protein
MGLAQAQTSTNSIQLVALNKAPGVVLTPQSGIKAQLVYRIDEQKN